MYSKINKPKEDKKVQKVTYTGSYVVTGQSQIELLDFLLQNVKHQSRNNIKTMLKNKCVLVDGVVTTRHDYLLTKKQLVQITKSPVFKDSKTKKSIKLDILFEDDELLVINKPAGLLSIATDKESVDTAYHYAIEYVRKNNPKNQIFIVHRLDKETSGVLMFCKNPQIRDLLQEKWNDIVTLREYYCVCEGIFRDKKATIKSYLAETSTHIVYSSRGKTGKLSITNYEVVKEGKFNSLVRVNIDSGRKNQIRVHLSEEMHPILGDYKYGDPAKKQDRLYLHASCLEFIHPVKHKVYKFEAKVPHEFHKIIK